MFSLTQWIILVLVVVLYGFSVFIARKEQRSASTWKAERILAFRIKYGLFTIPDDPVKFLSEQALENEMRYELPIALRLTGKMQRVEMAGLDCIVLGGASASPLRILYLHGGAYVQQPLLPHWTFLDRLAKKTKAEIIAPLYPKATLHTYAETFGMLERLYRLLLDICGGCATIFMGDSAGGGLALAFAQALKEYQLPQPKRLILLSPWLDVSMENADMDELEAKDPMLQRSYLITAGKAWAGATDVHDYKVSPIYGSCAHVSPITLFVGTHELFLADAKKFAHIAKNQNAQIDVRIYPKMNHVFPLFPIPEAKMAMREIVELIHSDQR